MERFYKNGDFENIGIKRDFDSNDDKQVVIVTHGRIVEEAIEASESLKNEGVEVGILLLEILKPYDESAKRILAALPKSVRAVLFLEEEILSGGMGMNLLNKLRGNFDEQKIRYDMLATDDNFVSRTQKGQNAYESAGVDRKSIVGRIKAMT